MGRFGFGLHDIENAEIGSASTGLKERVQDGAGVVVVGRLVEVLRGQPEEALSSEQLDAFHASYPDWIVGGLRLGGAGDRLKRFSRCISVDQLPYDMHADESRLMKTYRDLCDAESQDQALAQIFGLVRFDEGTMATDAIYITFEIPTEEDTITFGDIAKVAQAEARLIEQGHLKPGFNQPLAVEV